MGIKNYVNSIWSDTYNKINNTVDNITNTITDIALKQAKQEKTRAEEILLSQESGRLQMALDEHLRIGEENVRATGDFENYVPLYLEHNKKFETIVKDMNLSQKTMDIYNANIATQLINPNNPLYTVNAADWKNKDSLTKATAGFRSDIEILISKNNNQDFLSKSNAYENEYKDLQLAYNELNLGDAFSELNLATPEEFDNEIKVLDLNDIVVDKVLQDRNFDYLSELPGLFETYEIADQQTQMEIRSSLASQIDSIKKVDEAEAFTEYDSIINEFKNIKISDIGNEMIDNIILTLNPIYLPYLEDNISLWRNVAEVNEDEKLVNSLKENINKNFTGTQEEIAFHINEEVNKVIPSLKTEEGKILANSLLNQDNKQAFTLQAQINRDKLDDMSRNPLITDKEYYEFVAKCKTGHYEGLDSDYINQHKYDERPFTFTQVLVEANKKLDNKITGKGYSDSVKYEARKFLDSKITQSTPLDKLNDLVDEAINLSSSEELKGKVEKVNKAFWGGSFGKAGEYYGDDDLIKEFASMNEFESSELIDTCFTALINGDDYTEKDLLNLVSNTSYKGKKFNELEYSDKIILASSASSALVKYKQYKYGLNSVNPDIAKGDLVFLDSGKKAGYFYNNKIYVLDKKGHIDTKYNLTTLGEEEIAQGKYVKGYWEEYAG